MRISRRRARASARSRLGQWLKLKARRSEFIRLPLYLQNLQLVLYVSMGMRDEKGERSARKFCDKGFFFRLTLLSRGGVDFLIHTLPWRAERCYHNGEDVVCSLNHVLIMCSHFTCVRCEHVMQHNATHCNCCWVLCRFDYCCSFMHSTHVCTTSEWRASPGSGLKPLAT